MPTEPSSNKRLIGAVILSSFLSGGLAGGLSAWAIPRFINSQANQPIPLSVTDAPVIANQDELIIHMVEQASPAVVSINVTKEISRRLPRGRGDTFVDPNEPFSFDPFMFPGPNARNQNQAATSTSERLRIGGGSGFFVSADGLVVTNRHVVDDAKAEYTVVTQDGQTYPSKIIAIDTVLDLAILKVEGQNFPYLKLGDSDKATVGQTVIAIGYALGEFENSVTKGVVSGLNRRIVAGGEDGSEVIESAIQTDAAINYGNSGGPLIDLAGQVIGVNTAISEDGQSLGFALPATVVARAVESVKAHGRIIRPWMGVRYVILDEVIAKREGFTQTAGALVLGGQAANEPAVLPDSPAARAGLKEKDIIVEVNGQKLDAKTSLANLLQKYAPGDTLRLKIIREGQTQELPITLAERPTDE